MNQKLLDGARVITDNWLKPEKWERVLIVTCEEHQHEVSYLEQYIKETGSFVDTMLFQKRDGQIGHYFDEKEHVFDSFDIIVGATKHSLVTTKAVKKALERGSRFLSLPLSTNNGRSLLEFDFLHMDMEQCMEMADRLMPAFEHAKELHVETAAGTDLTFSMEGRKANLFTGDTKFGKGYASSSFEIFIPILETKTNGIGIVDGSLGYLGTPKEPVRIELQNGKIIDIEQNDTGRILQEYLESFEDDRMYVAGEFGIGLNTCSTCCGNCYIEDESAYKTFHIGFGRNIAFGGAQEAKGHFDLVFHEPDIYVDGRLVMKKGGIL